MREKSLDIVDQLCSLDPRQLDVLHAAMDKVVKGHPYAKATIDVACYDIAGKAADVPVSMA